MQYPRILFSNREDFQRFCIKLSMVKLFLQYFYSVVLEIFQRFCIKITWVQIIFGYYFADNIGGATI